MDQVVGLSCKEFHQAFSWSATENVRCILLYVHEFRWTWTALHCIEDDLGSSMITQEVKMLTSPDPLIREMAEHSLNLRIQKRCGGVEGPEDRWRYLSGQLSNSRAKMYSDVSTIWSRVKAFCSDRNIRWCGGGENCPPSSITIADQVLDSHLRENPLRRLCDGRPKHWHNVGQVLQNRVGLLTLSAKHLSPTIGYVTVSISVI